MAVTVQEVGFLYGIKAELAALATEESGWVFVEDKHTGTKIFQNKLKRPTVKLEITQKENGKEKLKIIMTGGIITVDPEKGIDSESGKKIKPPSLLPVEAAVYKCSRADMIRFWITMAPYFRILGMKEDAPESGAA